MQKKSMFYISGIIISVIMSVVNAGGGTNEKTAMDTLGHYRCIYLSACGNLCW